MIPFSRITHDQEEIDAVTRVMNGDWWACGPETQNLEQEFADYVGSKYAIFTSSCTSALEMAHRIAKEYGWHRFSYTPNTFCATYASGVMVGQKIDQNDPQYHVSVHYGGTLNTDPCFIEDSAHRIMPNDTWIGKIKCYSLYATKNMTCASGGFFCTNDDDIYEMARLMWKDGLSTSTYERQTKGYDYDVKIMSGGYDSNDILASIARVQLKKLPEFNKRRTEIRDKYNKAFGLNNEGLHLYPVSDDKELVSYLLNNKIRSGYFYPPQGKVCLPIYPLLTDEEVDYIIKNVKEYMRGNEKTILS